MNANTSIAAVIPILSARKPTICGVTIPPNAAIARNNDIPVVEPLIILPTLDTVVGYIPAKKKPSPAIATVMTARLCAIEYETARDADLISQRKNRDKAHAAANAEKKNNEE